MIGDIIIANVIASGILVVLIYLLDLNEKEPPWTLVRIYLMTILMTFLFGKLKGYLFTHFDWSFSPLFTNYVVAGFFEELLKFIVVMVFVWPLASFNEETDGIIYYLIVAAGFTVLENVGYSFRFVINPWLFGMQTGQMEPYRQALQAIVMVRAVSGHVFINVSSGFFLGLAKRRKAWWLLIPGFLISVFLHGTWNQSITSGFWYFVIVGYFLLNACLFYGTIRMSFYFKFMRRLKYRMQELIREAREKALDEDVIVLMEDIHRNVRTLRQMEGPVLTEQAKTITQLLPSHADSVPRYGEGGMNEILLKINGLLGRDRRQKDWWFWMRLFLMFALTGFVVLLALMLLM